MTTGQIQDPLLAPCGLYCGFCGVLQAHQSGNQKMKQKLANLFGCQPDQIACSGCQSDNTFMFCRSCGIRSCTDEKGYAGCFQCDDFPCRQVEEFPIEIGKRVILQTVPVWREMGTDAWLAAEKEKYACRACGAVLIRGGKRCGACGQPSHLSF